MYTDALHIHYMFCGSNTQKSLRGNLHNMHSSYSRNPCPPFPFSNIRMTCQGQSKKNKKYQDFNKGRLQNKTSVTHHHHDPSPQRTPTSSDPPTYTLHCTSPSKAPTAHSTATTAKPTTPTTFPPPSSQPQHQRSLSPTHLAATRRGISVAARRTTPGRRWPRTRTRCSRCVRRAISCRRGSAVCVPGAGLGP